MSTELPVLYTFRRCPYAIRARLAIAYSGQSVELREILLKDKPEAFLKLVAKATVPVLLLADGHIIDESWDIMLWALEQNDPANWLDHRLIIANDMSQLVEENDNQFKPNLDRYKYAPRYPEQTESEYRILGERFLQKLERHLELTPNLVGERLTLEDAAIFPFIRQFAGVDPKWFQSAAYPNLRLWLQHWLDSELFKSVMQKYAPWHEGDNAIIFPPSH